MVRKRLFYWEFIGFGTVCLLGVLGHFVYDWTGEHPKVAAIVAVNESIWEHMKLLYVPYFLYTLAECFTLARELENFLSAKATGALTGILAIPLIHYSLSGALGTLPDFVNITIFFISVATAFWVSHRIMKHDRLRGGWGQATGFLLLWGLMLLFILWTYHPPTLPLFIDPVTGQYGMA